MICYCLRLKQLYDKFDDVVASGRMIAKVSDTTDGSASSSIANGKKRKKKNSIILYITDTIYTYMSGKAFIVYCSYTFARVHIYMYSYASFLCIKRNLLSTACFGFFFAQTPYVYVTKKEREGVRVICASSDVRSI
jgi:hypothetical protein